MQATPTTTKQACQRMTFSINLRRVMPELGPSKLLAYACLLEHLIGRVPRLDLAVDRNVALCDRAVPNLVVALPRPNELAVVLPEKFANLTLDPAISAMLDWGRERSAEP